MKFTTFLHKGTERIGLIDKDDTKIIDLTLASKGELPNSLLECLQDTSFISNVKKLQKNNLQACTYNRSEVTLLAPIPKPVKNVICIGKNYAEHAIEMGSKADIPEHPIVFTKPPTAVIGPEERVLLHEEVTRELDYEGELAVVIGKRGRGIAEDEAESYIFGYTIVNDITARDLQKQHKQFFIGKSLDTTCPIGPVIVHKSLIENPHNLAIETKVNGEVRQSSSTENMIFKIESLIATLSKGMTLEPGDIIATGTPAGVGKGFTPPKFLQDGDEIEITIAGIGTLRNKVMREGK
jgi:2-keto-4-pentenoate hydratase/2-oxohepta-3-ene-1,7-dioic acid hydratase in catechol pathway